MKPTIRDGLPCGSKKHPAFCLQPRIAPIPVHDAVLGHDVAGLLGPLIAALTDGQSSDAPASSTFHRFVVSPSGNPYIASRSGDQRFPSVPPRRYAIRKATARRLSGAVDISWRARSSSSSCCARSRRSPTGPGAGAPPGPRSTSRQVDPARLAVANEAHLASSLVSAPAKCASIAFSHLARSSDGADAAQEIRPGRKRRVGWKAQICSSQRRCVELVGSHDPVPMALPRRLRSRSA